MNKISGVRSKKKRIDKIIGLLLILTLIAFSPSSLVSVAGGSGGSGGSGGLATLDVTVDGLTNNSGIDVIVEKEIDGVLTYYYGTTDAFGHVIFNIPFGGTARVYGEPVSGYITPEATVSLTQLKGNLRKSCTLTYVASITDIKVTGISVTPETAFLIIGQTIQLNATVEPANATEKTVSWSSDNESVATVSEVGMVTAVAEGEATITCTTIDQGTTDTCAVTVATISPLNPEPLSASPGETVSLPDTVVANLSSGGTDDVPVVWSLVSPNPDALLSTINGIQYITFSISAPTGDTTLVGDVLYSSVDASLIVTVSGTSVIPIISATLNYESLGLYIGLDRDEATLILTVFPEGADTSELIWESTNNGVVQVLSVAPDRKSAVVQAVAVGDAAIRVIMPGNPERVLVFCPVSVATDPDITDPAYISATLENDPAPVDQFAKREDVFIRCYNLPDGIYHIKVTDKGNGSLLGIGTVQVSGVDSGSGIKEFKYNLYTETSFSLTNNYSASYFVYMSKDISFPSGDDEITGFPKTFSDNFKVTSPVPTGVIEVTVEELIGGNPSSPSEQIAGRYVILCRELEGSTYDMDYEDYLLGYQPGGEPLFSDEVKLIGQVLDSGVVNWETPKEKLKIGGYVLLMELPEGYHSNLNLPLSGGEDGELVKDIHILRNTTIYRTIQVWN